MNDIAQRNVSIISKCLKILLKNGTNKVDSEFHYNPLKRSFDCPIMVCVSMGENKICRDIEVVVSINAEDGNVRLTMDLLSNLENKDAGKACVVANAFNRFVCFYKFLYFEEINKIITFYDFNNGGDDIDIEFFTFVCQDLFEIILTSYAHCAAYICGHYTFPQFKKACFGQEHDIGIL